MAQQAERPVHTLMLPNAGLPLLVPSAIVAEVVNVPPEFTDVPFRPPWMLGVIGWRQRPVPIISFEAMLGGTGQLATPRSKIIIFYPLPGRNQWDFFGVLTSSEPQPYTISNTENMVAQAPKSEYIATALKIGGLVAGIPNLEAIKKTFYP